MYNILGSELWMKILLSLCKHVGGKETKTVWQRFMPFSLNPQLGIWEASLELKGRGKISSVTMISFMLNTCTYMNSCMYVCRSAHS